MGTRLLAAGCVVVLLPFCVFGQQQAPVFKARVDLVTVDVHVVDRDSHPVLGLTRSDFVVTVDGRPRSIATADYVSYPARGAVEAVPVAPARPEPLVSTNLSATAAVPGRLVFLVVDEANIRSGAGRLAAEAGERFLETLRPNDQVGLVTIPYTTIAVEPTTDRTVVRQALERITGHMVPLEIQQDRVYSLGISEAFAQLHDARRWAEVVQRECEEKPGRPESCPGEMQHYAVATIAEVRQRMLESVRAFEGVIDGLAVLPGPKTLVLVSEELPVSSYLAEQHDFNVEAERITEAAARAQVSTYVLQLHAPMFDVENRTDPPSSGADADMRASGLETITSLTGGRRMMVSGRVEAAFDRIALEISGYYLLGFQAEGTDRDGKPHEIKVAVKRRGVDVRARRAFAFAGAAEAAGGDHSARDVVTRLLRTSEPATGLPIAVATYTLANPGDAQVRVLISAEVGRGGEKPGGTAIGYAIFDRTGKNAGASVEEGVLRAVPDHPDAPLRYVGAAVLPPGRYTLRLAAADATLSAGSVVHAVDARLPEVEGGLTLSDLVLVDASTSETGPTQPSVSATLDRELIGYFEAYPTAPLPADLAVRLEVAEAPGGLAVAAGRMTVEPAGEGRVRVSGSVPIAGLPGGTYVARAVLLSGGRSAGQLVRPFRVAPRTVAPGGLAPVSPPAAPAAALPPPAAPPVAQAAAPPPEAAPASPLPPPATPPAPAANLAQLLARTGQYVARYGEQMSVVIAVERYAQWMQNEDFLRPVSRQLVSEFALLRVKDDWLGYRDVYEVDGEPVGDRQDRLERLVTQSAATAVGQGRQIAEESARYNLGAIQRNFNVPTMALYFVQPANQKRFKFTRQGEDTIDGTPVWKVRYQEIGKPTIIRTSQGKDMPVSGTMWIDPLEGRVLKTHMEITSEIRRDVQDPRMVTDPGGFGDLNAPARSAGAGQVAPRVRTSASITVTYREEPRLSLLVPGEMLETYEGTSVSRFTGKESPTKINCRATYSDFKRFETSGRVVPPK